MYQNPAPDSLNNPAVLNPELARESMTSPKVAPTVIDTIEGTLPCIEEMQSEPQLPKLISLLKRAYSGERAAALAYEGHALSVSSQYERNMIEQIEQEELQHRSEVGAMLSELDSKPSKVREIIFSTIGHVLGYGCHLSGRFLPMYFAAKLEASNISEYEEAAQLAHDLDLYQMADQLKVMAEREREHERFFRECCAKK